MARPISNARVYADPITKQPTEVIAAFMDFTDLLASGETLTGTPVATVTGDDTVFDDANVTGETVNTGEVTRDDGSTVAIGKGVAMTLAGVGTDAARYRVQVTVGTSNSQTRVGDGPLWVTD